VTRPHEDAWARLEAAGAARLVRATEDLGGAVEALLAPDRAALMARAAWDVATAGAGAARLVADLVADLLPHPLPRSA
jgi:3-deoxy-D-manno-octulosonic-acid transferase